MTELLIPDRVRERRAEVRAFMEEHVYPNEAVLDREDDAADALLAELRAKAKAAGIWAPHLPPEAGGTGSGFIEYALLNEEIGRIDVGAARLQLPGARRGQRRDPAHVRHAGAEGAVPAPARRGDGALVLLDDRAATSPAPTRPRCGRARSLDGDEWVIDGHKWFSSGAEGAAFGIVMAVTDPDAAPHRRMSQILVPADTPGVEVVRPIPVLGHAGHGWTTHCEVQLHGRSRPARATSSASRGDGFRIAQKRLGPGRIHHVMRWLGQMQRAFELMCRYALEREVGGVPLAEKQTIQNWIADSAAEIQACRLMTLDAARKLDEGDEARVEVSLIKFYAARVLHDVIDRAIQTHGALGLTDRDAARADVPAMARGARIYDGPDEVHRMVVSRRILKEFAAGGTYRFD